MLTTANSLFGTITTTIEDANTLPSLAHLGMIATTCLLDLKVSRDATIPLPLVEPGVQGHNYVLAADIPCFSFRHTSFGANLSSFQW